MVLKNFLYQADLHLVGTEDPIVGHVRASTFSSDLTIGSDTNEPPDAVDPNTSMPIRVSGTRRFGITARHLVLCRLNGTAGNQFREYRRVVIFDPVFFISALSNFNADITYESLTDWFIVGGQHERYALNLEPT